MNPKILLLIISLFITLSIQSQENDNNLNNNYIQIGGTFNMGFGNNYSTFAIAPSAIYNFSENFAAGLSFKYVYVKNKSTVQRTTNIIGGSALALFRPINEFQLSLEFEQLHLKQKYASITDASLWQPALYIGAEYVTGKIAMGLRYDVLFNESENVIYSSALSPIFRIYF